MKSIIENYLIKTLTIPHPWSKYIMSRLIYLEEMSPTSLKLAIISQDLQEHLIILDKEAMEMEELLIQQMMMTDNITDKLKDSNPIAWIQAMNNIVQCTTEITMNELIYTNPKIEMKDDMSL